MKTKLLKIACIGLLILAVSLYATKYIKMYCRSIRADYFLNAKGKAENFLVSNIR